LSQITHDELARTWLLRMRSSAYAFGLTQDGIALRHRAYRDQAGPLGELVDA
jgi:hypothetical protein